MTLADLGWALEDLARRRPGYALCRQYDAGKHRLLFATDKFLNAFGDLFHEFADNMCDDVADALSDRLQIMAVSATEKATDTGESAKDDALESRVAEWWETVQGSSRTGAVHRNAVAEGDGFVIVQEDAEGIAQPWKQRPDQMAVRYSVESPDVIEVAAKVWRAGRGKAARWRATLYYPDGTQERYATRGVSSDGRIPQARSFKPLAPGDPDLVALGLEEYVTPDGVGMPVFHYPNGEVSDYGTSVIGKVIPVQDALNKSVADMLVAMEYHAYPQRWATGVQVEYNPVTGEERQPFDAGENRVWWTQSKDATMGQFDPAGMEGFLKVQDSFRLEIGRKGSLPPHALNLQSQSGTPPTGISLLVTEGRTIKWALDRQRDWGQQHRRMAAYALNLQTPGLAVTPRDLELQWAPPQTRDMLALLEELTLKVELGMPRKQALVEVGYDPADVDVWLAEREGEDDAQRAANDVLTGGRRAITTGQAQDLGTLEPDPAVA